MALDHKSTIYKPQHVAQYGYESATRMREHKFHALSLPLGGGFAEYFRPMPPGHIATVIAQTSNFKSGFLHAWEKMAAEQLVREGRLDEVILHISVEEDIETQSFYLYANEVRESAGKIAVGDIQDLDALERARINIGAIPIYRIGESIARPENIPNLYISNIVECIDYMMDANKFGRKIRIAAMYWDYLQAFPIDPLIKRHGDIEAQRRLQVAADLNHIRQISIRYQCPSVVAVQAKQDVSGLGKNMLIPGVYDGMETAAIATRPERVITLWMPKMTHSLGAQLDHKDLRFTVTEDLLFVKVAKQRGGLPSGRVWMFYIDFLSNTINTEPILSNGR